MQSQPTKLKFYNDQPTHIGKHLMGMSYDAAAYTHQALAIESQVKNWQVTHRTSTPGYFFVDTPQGYYLVKSSLNRTGTIGVHYHQGIQFLKSEAQRHCLTPALGFRIINNSKGINDFVLITLDEHRKVSAPNSIFTLSTKGRTYNSLHFQALSQFTLLAAVRYDPYRGQFVSLQIPLTVKHRVV